MSGTRRLVGGAALALASAVSMKRVYAREKSNQAETRVWMTGSKFAIPNGSLVDLDRPTPIDWFTETGKSWTKITTGPFFGSAVSSDGQTFVWAYDKEKQAHIGPRLLTSVKKVIEITATEELLVVLEENGSCVSIYDPFTLACVSKISSPNSSWLSSNKFVSVSAGRRHIALLDSAGHVWTAGDNSEGQCGKELEKNRKKFDRFNFYNEEESVKNPIDWAGSLYCPYPNHKALSVVCGGKHTVIITDENKAVSFGDDSKIQLGLGDTRSQDVPDYVPHSGMGQMDAEITNMQKLFHQTMPAVKFTFYDRHLRCKPTDMKVEGEITGAVLGEDFSILKIGDSGLMLGCGENQFGQCGRGLNKQQQTFAPVKLPKAVKSKQVSCGASHCIASLEDGSIYAWGANSQGQLGTGNRAAACPPAVIHRSKIRGPLVTDIITKIGREPDRSVQEIEEFLHERRIDAIKAEAMLTSQQTLPEPHREVKDKEKVSTIKQDLLDAIDKSRAELMMTPDEQAKWCPRSVHASYMNSMIVMEKTVSP